MARFFRAPDRRQRFLLPLDMMEWLPEDVRAAERNCLRKRPGSPAAAARNGSAA